MMNQLFNNSIKLLNLVRCQPQLSKSSWQLINLNSKNLIMIQNYSTKTKYRKIWFGFRLNQFSQFNSELSNRKLLIRESNSIADDRQRGDSLTFAKNGKRFSKKRSPFGYIFMLLPLATFCLGTWQVYRRQWKLDLIAKLESLIESSPIDFPERLSDLHDMEYSKVKVRGYLDQSSKPIFVFPRTIINDNQPKTKSNSSKSQYEPGTGLFSTSNSSRVGAQLVMPFVVTENHLITAYNNQIVGTRTSTRSDGTSEKIQEPFRILVNLGWVSRETMEKINQQYAMANPVVNANGMEQNDTNDGIINQSPNIQIVGIVRKTEKREPFKTKQESNYGYWNRRDIPKMSTYLETSPIFLDAFESYPISLLNNTIEVAPIGGQTRVSLRNEHLSYIFTWYSLTGLFSFLWYSKIFKPRL